MRYRLGVLILAAWSAVAGCSSPPPDPPVSPAGRVVLFEGARLIAGDGTAPIERSAFLVRGDAIADVGTQGALQPPADALRVDLRGKTVIPALVDAHSHLGYTNVGAMTTAASNFTRENLVDHLRRYAYYGIAATLSMGVDRGESA